ncbi:MotE family protein [Saccharibacillus alkalitolerans]|uniref:Kinesin n=1 Tax=Saccharibacillus alkalitolerans TaxID=2705290 RepID=A0ABX0F668_9BACL|nr:kinesin [Saccharibacillus alkalitolerans]NGZ75504.1 kinesin [Saccharibacillus alkalitolerans]
MAKTQAEAEIGLEEESGSKAGRILLFAVPILFTVVLVGVLITLMNPNTRNSVLETANKVPVVGSLLPKPTYTPEQQAERQKEQQAASAEATIDKLKAQLEQKNTELKTAQQAQADTQAQVDSLQKKLDDTQAQQEEQQAAAAAAPEEKEGPSDQVKQLARTYGAMSASKAAPILDTLTKEEIAMILNAMSTEQKSAILQRMTADKAAEVSIMLKNASSAAKLESAANAARAAAASAEQPAQKTTANGSLNQDQLSQTFSSMDASSASALLVQMSKTNQTKVLTILKSVDDSTRSNILSQMASTDSETAALLANKLIGG